MVPGSDRDLDSLMSSSHRQTDEVSTLAVVIRYRHTRLNQSHGMV